MVKWKDSWLEAEDINGVTLNLWLQKDDEYYGYCKLLDAKSNIILKVHRHSLSTPKRKNTWTFLILDFQLHRCIFQKKQNHQHPQK